ncbi:MAG: hypothetical protein HYY06_27540 [Deltaproteobacteria bacterium]|nr:hypothetical protein [Deltaproteobacteria bacterium]
MSKARTSSRAPDVVLLGPTIDAVEFGSKASTLGLLVGAGLDVPPGFAVRKREPSAAAGTTRELEAARRAMLEDALPGELVRRIQEECEALGPGAVAVRSSSTREDLASLSGAGLQDSFLNVEGLPAVLDAVRSCWASLLTERAVHYLSQMGVSWQDAGIGVVVQRMVRAEVSGIAFTRDPLSGARQTVINASWGLGSSVASGAISPDSFAVDPSGSILRRSIGEKRSMVVAVPGGLAEVATDDRGLDPCLDDEQVRAIAALAARIEGLLGAPQDVEWAIADGRIWVLQARPITALPGNGRRGGPRTVWSNVNVGEALPGVASPLTWSILSAFSDLGFRRAFGALGCQVPHGATLVGNFRGRIYLNLTEFMAIASQVPGLDPRTLLALGGGGGLAQLEADVPRLGSGGFLLRLPVTAGRLVASNLGLSARVSRFARDFAGARRRFAARDLGALSGPELAKVLDELGALLDRTGSLMLTCASNFLSSFLVLRHLLERLLPLEARRLELDLLSGSLEVESAAPGRELARIADLARRDPAARDLILGAGADRLGLADLPASSPVRAQLERFLDTFGYRAVREAELMTPRWREDPRVIFAALAAHLRARGEGRAAVDQRARALALIEAGLGRVSGAMVRAAAGRAARFAAERERMRARVTEVLGMVRAVALEVGSRLGGPDDGFMLSLDEMRGFCAGEALDLEPRIAARRAQWERDRSLPDPPGTFVGAPPPAEIVANLGDALEGLPASPGTATGPARVLVDPADAASLREGEVLVVRSADVGWAPLSLVASAVVCELGGTLSHAAIVAREYGVPAVVNVAGAARRIRTGDRVTVSGDAGKVWIHQAVGPSAG